MSFTIILTCIAVFLAMMVLSKNFRYYIYSFFLTYIYQHPKLAQYLGYKYESDENWTTNRKESEIYMPGLFVKLFTLFTGMDMIMKTETKQKFIKIQKELSGQIDMTPYFNQIVHQEMTLREFEDYISDKILIETNRVFQIVNDKTEQKLLTHIKILRIVVSGLITNSAFSGVTNFIKNFRSVIIISKILHSVPEHLRLLLFVPQLTLLDGMSRLLLKNKGRTEELEPHHFLEKTSDFFIFMNHGVPIFVTKHKDYSNNYSNRAFGPKGYQCPGRIYTFKYIESILNTLKKFQINIQGEPCYDTGRFKHLLNVEQIQIKITN